MTNAKSFSWHIKSLSTTEVLRQAVQRYEDVWLPLLAKKDSQARLVPPLDVEWVWHCHMLFGRKPVYLLAILGAKLELQHRGYAQKPTGRML